MDKTRDILKIIRTINEGTATNHSGLILEEADKTNAIAITDDPKFGDHVLSNQIDQFRNAVESGAQFSNPNEGNESDKPLIYLPKDGNLIFSGIIPCLNNLKWQFVLKTNTGNGCFIWADGLVLTKENIPIITKLFGFYENWREEFNREAKNLEQLGRV